MGFFKNILRANTAIGSVSGSDFNNCQLNMAKKDGSRALLISGLGKEDFVFDKSDVKEFSVVASNVNFKLGTQPKIGNKYKIEFNNGKTAIVSVPAHECEKIENILY
jgi:hypothetical protein